METEHRHARNGVSILEKTFYEAPVSRASSSSYSRSSSIMTFTVGRAKNYSFVAYPGPAVVTAGSRAEHLPLHFHVRCKQSRELRILTEDFSEYDGQHIPRDLRNYFQEEGVAQYLRESTKSIFETGELSKEIIYPK